MCLLQMVNITQPDRSLTDNTHR